MPSRPKPGTGSIGFYIALVVSLGAVQASGADANPTFPDVIKAWTERQSKVQTARFELKNSETIHPAPAAFAGETGKTNSTAERPTPPGGRARQNVRHVILSGAKIRQDYARPIWDADANEYFEPKIDEGFDGAFQKLLFSRDSARSAVPSGTIRRTNNAHFATSKPIAPIVLAFRGVHEPFVPDLNQFESLGRIVQIGVRRCLELEKRLRAGNARELLYVDPERGFVVVRSMSLFNEQPRSSLTIDYQPDGIAGWVPSSWEYVVNIMPNGRPLHSGRIQVISYELNGDIPDSEFDFQWPIGTCINDNSSGAEQRYVIGPNDTRESLGRSTNNAATGSLQVIGGGNTIALVLAVASAILALGLLYKFWHRSRPPRRVSV